MGTTISSVFMPTARPAAPSDERTQKAREALAAMKEANKAQRQSTKNAAKEKLQRIKQELNILRRLYTDPKLIAREAARLARELGAAIRDYAGAHDSGSSDALDEAENGLLKVMTAETAAEAATAAEEMLEDVRSGALKALDEGEARELEATDDGEFLRLARGLFQKLKDVIEENVRKAEEREKDSSTERLLKDAQAAADAAEETNPANPVPFVLIV